ncbi:hypothetical protein OK074_2532 [Actinobacteria bacterium OK074]|nr:hypothetical protein OK074_2532 [Actinobacteria bacterium OK074]
MREACSQGLFSAMCSQECGRSGLFRGCAKRLFRLLVFRLVFELVFGLFFSTGGFTRHVHRGKGYFMRDP